MDGRKCIIIAALCVYDNGFEIFLKNHNNIMGARVRMDISRIRMYTIMQKQKTKKKKCQKKKIVYVMKIVFRLLELRIVFAHLCIHLSQSPLV